ncbi:MAG: tetratricopeptide repeat protein, partial [Anaerolineae bacterium]
NLIGAAYYSMGRYGDAEKYWGNAFELFESLGDRRKGMDVLNNLGVIADARGDYAQAFLRYDRALEIAREMGYRDGEIVFLTNRGGVQAARSNFSAAEADMLQAIELAGKGGSWILPKTYYFLAEASVRTGKREQALHAAQVSLDLSRADGAPEYVGAAYRALGMISKELCAPVSVRSGDAEPKLVMADELFQESVRVLEDGNLDIERAITLREWARYEIKDGNRQRGAELWKEARDIFWQLGANMEYERMAELPA